VAYTKRFRVDTANIKVQAYHFLAFQNPRKWWLTQTPGTWVPLDRAREIAAQYNVEELLMPIFNFRPSTESPPLAPKHITAASTKPRPARAPARPPLVKRVPSTPIIPSAVTEAYFFVL
jgi:hypothetical protein